MAVPPFDALTAAEASVFEKALEARRFARGSEIATDGGLLVLSEGAIGLSVRTARGDEPLMDLAGGDFLGEIVLFEPEPVVLRAVAQSDSSCYSLERQSLLNVFRYSRTGAVKCMGLFARSLSRKIRAANDLLKKSPPSASSVPEPARPLAERDLDRVKALSVVRREPAGTVIFKEGDESQELFIIGEGDIEIVKDAASATPLVLARLGQGDFFGEMAFVDREPRSASAVARTAVELHVVPAGALERLPELHIGTAIYLANVTCKIMARRLNATLKRFSYGRPVN